MTLGEMVSAFYDRTREDSSGSVFTESMVKKWINGGYRNVLSLKNWDWLVKEYKTDLAVTTCSAAGASTGTTLYAASATGFQAGMDIWVCGGAAMERVKIESINYSTNLITLESPGLYNSFTSGDSITQAIIFLPCDCRTVVSVKVRDMSDNTAARLAGVEWDHFDDTVAAVSLRSMPTHYFSGGIDNTLDAFSDEASAGTTEKIVYETTLGAEEENYYKGWLFINKTLNKSARVESYNRNNRALVLETGIAGQDAGDLFNLYRALEKIYLYPAPDQTYRIIIRYISEPVEMTADSEAPNLGPGSPDYDMLVDYAIAEAFITDKNQALAGVYLQKFREKAGRLIKRQDYVPDRFKDFRTADNVDLPGFSY